MLNYELKGSYKDATGFIWEYYQDDMNLSIFYVMPRPEWVLDTGGKPQIKLVKYDTDNPATKGSGYVTFNTQLTVPTEVDAGVKSQIAIEFPAAPAPYQLNPLTFNPGCTATFDLDVQNTITSFMGDASEFGSNVATFRCDLTADGMKTISGLLSTAGGGLDITYDLNVEARLNAVTATLHFDSATAYQYQVQHAQHHAYAADTPRIVTKLLTQSASSSVNLKWGIQSPSSDLVTSVTEWANATIGSLVSAEVKTALNLLGEQSYDSFKISDVSSFTSVYETDQVINWKLYPKASLPAVANLDEHTTVVNARQQVMTISTNLPFKGSKVQGANIPKVDAKPVQLKQVTVKVSYPGLSQADSTFVFTDNGSHTFTAPYDETQGDAYDVSWTAEYADGSQNNVTGQQKDVTEGHFNIQLPSVGLLTVTFEARNAFAALKAGSGESTPPVVTSIDIDFYFASDTGAGKSIHHNKTILAPAAPPSTTDPVLLAKAAHDSSTQVVFTSYVAHNVVTGTAYSYSVTYHFAQGPDFVAEQVSSTAYNHNIATPPAPNPTNVLVFATAPAGQATTIAEADVKVWFDTDITIPGAGPQPTSDNPTSFSLEPDASKPKTFARDTFLGFLHGHTPLVYSASITTMTGDQINIQPTLLQNKQAAIAVSPTERYTTLTVLMDAVKWSSTSYDKIILSVNATAKNSTGSGCTPIGSPTQYIYVPPADAKAHNMPRYITYSHHLDQDVIDFTWTAQYVTSGTGHTTATGTGTSAVPSIIVPAEGTSDLVPPPTPLSPIIAT